MYASGASEMPATPQREGEVKRDRPFTARERAPVAHRNFLSEAKDRVRLSVACGSNGFLWTRGIVIAIHNEPCIDARRADSDALFPSYGARDDTSGCRYRSEADRSAHI